jgi:Putative zinc-finger
MRNNESTSGNTNTSDPAADDVMTDLAPSCKAAARLMSESRDRSLSKVEEQSLNRHLAICKNCVRFDKQLDFLSELAKRYAAGKVDSKS